MKISKKRGGLAGGVLTIIVALIAAYVQNGQKAPSSQNGSSRPAGQVERTENPSASPSHRSTRTPSADAGSTSTARRQPKALLDAIRNKKTKVIVDVEAQVSRILPDDDEGDRHQRFLIRLDSGQTILIAHNISLAHRVPVQRGDTVLIHGQYEWNDRGGVIHWTHRDPKGWREDGWIVHDGTEYR